MICPRCGARAFRVSVTSCLVENTTVADELWVCRSDHRFVVELDTDSSPPGAWLSRRTIW